MTVKCQCEYCNHYMALPDNLAGRKILCPMCEDPLVIPKADPARAFKKFVLADSIGKFRFNDWDKAFSCTMLERETLEEKALYKALVDFRKAARKRSEISLSEFLLEAEIISTGECERIRSIIKGSVVSAKAEFTECPNCFANVASDARACKFCGQQLGAAASVALCPNCKYEQPAGIARCRHCHADMKTGLRPGQEALQASGKRKGRRSRRKAMGVKLLAGIAAGVLLVGWIAWHPVKTAIRCVVVGTAQATLEEEVRCFGIALRKNALETIEEMVDPEANAIIERDTRGLILLGTPLKGTIKKVLSITPGTIALLDGDKKATLEVHVVADVEPESNKILKEAGAFFRPSERKEFTATWTWVRGANGWRYAAPLPMVKKR